MANGIELGTNTTSLLHNYVCQFSIRSYIFGDMLQKEVKAFGHPVQKMVHVITLSVTLHYTCISSQTQRISKGEEITFPNCCFVLKININFDSWSNSFSSCVSYVHNCIAKCCYAIPFQTIQSSGVLKEQEEL